jgi:antitoxin (DNA-binding transcriptional repressor) of toxin-antitoxin stability system
MDMEDKQVRSDDLRTGLRAILNGVEHQGEHVTVLRYDTPAAVIVPVGWYEQARAALGATSSTRRGDRQ